MAGFIGKAVVIKVDTSTTGTPTWVKVAGQQGGNLSRTVETIEATTKDSDSKEFVGGMGEWSMECDGIYQIGDAGFAKLETAFALKQPVKVQIALPSADATKFDFLEGLALITELPLDFNTDDLATYSVTLQGTGALTKRVASAT